MTKSGKKSLEQKIGQLFILGFTGATIQDTDNIAGDIEERNLGGLILFDRFLAGKKETHNIVDNTQLSKLTSDLQDLATTPLLIAVDQEGGKVNRFKKERGFPVSPTAAELGDSGKPEKTRQSGVQTARMLKEVGVNLNLAPVVDLNVYEENPIIGRYERSFSADPVIVAAHSAKWIQAHKEQGVLSCLKHFPGHGSARSDSHLGFVDITATWSKEELLPYQHHIAAHQADAIMVGHLFNKKFDDRYPATLSPATTQTLLRQQLGFNGLIISDDMQMGAITEHYGLEEACCRALAAGVDLLIIGNNLHYEPTILKRVTKTILKGLDRGIVTETRIEEAWNQVQKFKQLL